MLWRCSTWHVTMLREQECNHHHFLFTVIVPPRREATWQHRGEGGLLSWTCMDMNAMCNNIHLPFLGIGLSLTNIKPTFFEFGLSWEGSNVNGFFNSLQWWIVVIRCWIRVFQTNKVYNVPMVGEYESVQQSSIWISRYLDQRLRSARPRRVLIRGEQRLGPADGHVRAAARGVILKHSHFTITIVSSNFVHLYWLVLFGEGSSSLCKESRVKDVRAVGKLGGGGNNVSVYWEL